jgi:protein involved in temperature-dependent protein secretion
MKAITTRYQPPTTHRGARIVATDGDRNAVSLPYDYAGPDIAHAKAALALCKKMGWAGELHSGHTSTGRVFVWHDSGSTIIAPSPRPPGYDRE